MEKLRRQEEKDELKQDGLKIRWFQEEINKTYDNNLDNCLMKFIDENNLENSEIGHWLRKFVQELKKTDNKK